MFSNTDDLPLRWRHGKDTLKKLLEHFSGLIYLELRYINTSPSSPERHMTGPDEIVDDQAVENQKRQGVVDITHQRLLLKTVSFVYVLATLTFLYESSVYERKEDYKS